MTPACDWLSYATLDEDGYILVDHDHMTVTDGLFAAGDCVHGSTHKLSCAVGDATICVESIDIYLDERV